MTTGSTPPAAAQAAAALVADRDRVAATRRITPSSDTRTVLDRVAALAARVLGVSAAQVSLLSDVQLVAGGHGLPAGTTGSLGRLDESLCTLTAAAGVPVAIRDTRADARSQHLPPVVSGAALCYLGVPLHSAAGLVTGSLCVFDPAVHDWSDTDVESLQLLGRAVSTELELASLAVEYRSDRVRWGGGRGRRGGQLRLGAARRPAAVGRPADRDVRLPGRRAVRAQPRGLHRPTAPRRQRPGRAALAEAIASRGSFESEYRIVLPDGEERWIQARGQTLTDDRGEPTNFIGAAYDTTDVHDGQVRTARVLEAMPSGFLSMDKQWRFTSLNAAAERMLGCGRSELLGRTDLEAFPGTVGTEFEAAYRETVRTGTARTLEAFYPAPLDAWFDILCWPTPDGLSLFFSDTTDRKRSAATAAAATARLGALASVNADLLEADDVAAVVAQLPRRLVPALAAGCIATLIDDAGRPRDLGSWHADPDLAEPFRTYAARRLTSVGPDSPLLQLLRTGQAVHHTTADAVSRHLTDPAAATALLSFGARISAVAVRAHGRVLGALTLYDPVEETASDDAGTAGGTLQAIADRIGLALDNARLSRVQAQLAESLQRSLLTAPPQPDHGQIVVRYMPATQAAQVGGDWYDAFVQPGGTTMLVIGDVVGHDTAAATASMAQLRGLLRGIATYSDAGPAEVLRGLDTAMQVLEVGTLATATIARFEQTPEELGRGVTRMVWAAAGHPPPLVLDAAGDASVPADWKGDLLLGVDPGTVRREHTVTLERDSTVLLYTDGLIERRDTDLDDGLERLAEAVAALRGSTLDELCDGVLARMVDHTPEDDVALVAIRLHRQDQPRPPEAGPQHVPPGIDPPEEPAG